jgi:hypothetical protein
MLESITVITLLLSALIVWSMNRKVASSAFRLASRGMGRSKKKVALSNSLAYSTQTLQDDRYLPAVTHYQPAPEAVLVAFHCQQRAENISI